MEAKVTVCLVLLICLQYESTEAQNVYMKHKTIADDVKFISDANNKLALKLLQPLSRSALENNANLIYSPISINLALAILQEGAKNNSEFQLKKLLELPNNPGKVRDGYKVVTDALRSTHPGNFVQMTNVAFLSTKVPVSSAYAHVITGDAYKSQIQNVPFEDPAQASLVINNWVAKNTHYVITDLVSPSSLPYDTRLVLANTLYYKGSWEVPFMKSDTLEEPFYTNVEGQQTKANMMHIHGTYRYRSLSNLDCEALELPYTDREYVMVILLPNEKSGLPKLIQQIRTYNLNDLLSDMYFGEVQLAIPRFEISSANSLADILKSLGLYDIFGSNADLSGITGSQNNLFVSDFFHKAKIEVDEEGTVAAGASGVFVVPLAGFLTPLKFIANHPFIYLIRHIDSNLILFAGHVSNPGLVGSRAPPSGPDHKHEFQNRPHMQGNNPNMNVAPSSTPRYNQPVQPVRTSFRNQ